MLRPDTNHNTLVGTVRETYPSMAIRYCRLVPRGERFLRSLRGIVLLSRSFAGSDMKRCAGVVTGPPFSNGRSVRRIELVCSQLRRNNALTTVADRR